MRIIQDGNIEAFNEMLNNGADVNFRDKKNWTPLHMAIRCNQEEMTKELLHKGVDIFSATHNGRNIIHFAVISTPSM